jgi:hypothetical protein
MVSTMSGRPWLEALKATMRERSVDTGEIAEKISETQPPAGCERCESLADNPTSDMDIQTPEKVHGSWGEERKLIDAGWKPKERGGLVIWANPETDFYYSQEMALHHLKRRVTL